MINHGLIIMMMMTVARAKNETVCSNPESTCLPESQPKPKGYLATEPCGDGYKCYLRKHEVSFGPFGNLGDPNDYPFSDKQLSENNGDIEKIDIFVGDFSGNAKIITGIQVTYGGVEGPLHGGGGTGEFYTISCESNVANGQFFGGTFGRARTNGGFDSFVYQLGFTQTSTNKQLCVAGTDNNNAEAFNIQAPIRSTFTLAFVSGTASLASGAGGMLGGLTFHFKSKAW